MVSGFWYVPEAGATLLGQRGEDYVKIGYIRVSTQEQNTIRQEVLMESLGVDEVYMDRMSGKSTDRPGAEEDDGVCASGGYGDGGVHQPVCPEHP